MERQEEELGQQAGNRGRCKNRWTGKNTRWMVGEKRCGMRRQKKLKEYIGRKSQTETA